MKSNTTKQHKPQYLGHRKRVKEKFIKNDVSYFYDYELLEILLFFSHPRKDTKNNARNLINDFENIANLINCDINLLSQNEHINSNSLILFKIIKEIINRNFLQEISQKSVIDNYDKLVNYCKSQLSHLKYEEFRILFLDKKNQLIQDYKCEEGLIDNVKIDLEKITRKAILLNAKSLILAHNHTSNVVKPSRNDILTTSKLANNLKVLNISIYDHLIIGKNNRYYSFRQYGLI